MNKEELVSLLKETGVIIDGHFLLTSGRHSDCFLQCSQLLQYPEKAAPVCRMMAEPFRYEAVDTVIGPAMGGIILSYEVARQLGVRAVYTERAESEMTMRRGFDLYPGERVLVVEDALTTGGSVQKVIDICRNKKANIIGVSVIVDRSPLPVDFGVPMKSLLKMELATYSTDECPLCRDRIPLQKPKN